MDICGTQGAKNERSGADEAGEDWRCTLIEPDTRLRVGRGIGQTETQAALELWQQVKQRQAHRTHPPALLSDGWGGHREALVQVYGQVPAYCGRGRSPSRKQPAATWQYTQMVKQRDEQGHFTGVDIRIIYGDETTLEHTGTRTVYVERTHLTSRLTRKSLGCSKQVAMLRAACIWEDPVYNFTRSLKSLRLRVQDGLRHWCPVSLP